MIFQDLDFFFIQAASWCVSNCSWCLKSWVSPHAFAEGKIKKNLDRIIQQDIFSNNIFIYNQDITTFSPDFFSYISSIESEFHNIFFHTDFAAIDTKTDIFKGKKCIYQRDIDVAWELKRLKNILENHMRQLPESIFVLWYEKPESLYRITHMLKNMFGNIKVQKEPFGGYSMQLENKIFKVFQKKWMRKELTNCFFDATITAQENMISVDRRKFSASWFEITISGDMRLHEPPCGLWNITVSNIYRESQQLCSDFEWFQTYIQGLNDSSVSQVDKCKKCNTLRYHYER